MRPFRRLDRHRGGVALLVDGPNLFRDAFEVDLDELGAIGERYGRLRVARLYLDERASEGLLRAAEARGFEAVVTSADVDVRLAVDAVSLLGEGLDALALASRDADFKPVLEAAARRGTHTVAIAPEGTRPDALANAADEAVFLGGP